MRVMAHGVAEDADRSDAVRARPGFGRRDETATEAAATRRFIDDQAGNLGVWRGGQRKPDAQPHPAQHAAVRRGHDQHLAAVRTQRREPGFDGVLGQFVAELASQPGDRRGVVGDRRAQHRLSISHRLP